MAKKPFVYLSTKSLKAVCDWCDANPQHPLSITYYGRCVGLVRTDPDHAGDVASALADLESNEWAKVFRAVRDSQLVAYQARDMIGRMVLAHIKRESKK